MTMILCQTEGCRICESIGGRPDPAKSRTASAPLDAASESCRPERKKVDHMDNKLDVWSKTDYWDFLVRNI